MELNDKYNLDFKEKREKDKESLLKKVTETERNRHQFRGFYLEDIIYRLFREFGIIDFDEVKKARKSGFIDIKENNESVGAIYCREYKDLSSEDLNDIYMKIYYPHQMDPEVGNSFDIEIMILNKDANKMKRLIEFMNSIFGQKDLLVTINNEEKTQVYIWGSRQRYYDDLIELIKGEFGSSCEITFSGANVGIENKNTQYREEIEKLLEEREYLENYLYAEFIIKTYIDDDRNYQKGRFYRVTKTNKNIFNYCVEVVKFLNPRLYQEYLKAVAESNIKKTKNMVTNLNNIVEGIKTGYLPDGSEFNILEFYRFVPLRESGFNFSKTLKDFMRQSDDITDEVYDCISEYMEKNDIRVIVFVTETYVKNNREKYSTDPRFTSKMIHNVFRYMFASGLPNIDHIFRILLEKYMNRELDFNRLGKMEDKSQKSKERKRYHNPYTLELKTGYEQIKK
ncbi:MAG: hypothetical protein OSJ70_09855 [Bacilli bacterium]|nr:hypothetical protein [Bacilli bacterium]